MGFHKTLGVATNATEQEIKTAYRVKALACHPDRCFEPDAAQRFSDIHEAYEALTRPKTQRPSTKKPTPPKRPRDPNNWIGDAPPPKYDIWGEPTDPNQPRENHAAQPRKSKQTQRSARKYEPPVDLWKAMETKASDFSRRYWVEYKRLVIEMAYEEPEKFWEALDEWTKNNK